MRGRCLVVLAALVPAACDQPGASRYDSWYTKGHPSGPELTRLGTSWKPLGEKLVYEVRAEARAEAVAMLDSEPLREIGVEKAAELIGFDPPSGERKRICLVRGVVLDRRTGRFTVYVQGRELFVHHECRGSKAMPMERQPLVVVLEDRPEAVWVGCDMRP